MAPPVNQTYKRLFVRWSKKHQKAMQQLALNPCDQTKDQVEWCKKHMAQYKAMKNRG